MTAVHPGVDAPADDWHIVSEADRVTTWRLHELIEAGWPVLLAERVASRIDIDLHRAVDLVAHGCPPALAADILL